MIHIHTLRVNEIKCLTMVYVWVNLLTDENKLTLGVKMLVLYSSVPKTDIEKKLRQLGSNQSDLYFLLTGVETMCKTKRDFCSDGLEYVCATRIAENFNIWCNNIVKMEELYNDSMQTLDDLASSSEAKGYSEYLKACSNVIQKAQSIKKQILSLLEKYPDKEKLTYKDTEDIKKECFVEGERCWYIETKLIWSRT